MLNVKGFGGSKIWNLRNLENNTSYNWRALTFYLHHWWPHWNCGAGQNFVVCLSDAAFSAHNNLGEGASCIFNEFKSELEVFSWSWLIAPFKFGPKLPCSFSSLPQHTSKCLCGLKWHVTRIRYVFMSCATTAESCNESTGILKMETKTRPAETLPHGWRGCSVLSGKERGG